MSRLLPIILPDGTIDPYADVAIQSAMLFPDDPESIEEDLRGYRLYIENGLPNRRLLKRQNQEWHEALPGGLYAGSMLMLMVQFLQHYPDMKVGMNKSAFANAAASKTFGRKLKKDGSTIKKYWREYKNSAHLWAAFMVEAGDFGSANPRKVKVPVDFLRVVGIADHLAEVGANVVEDWNPWRLPPNAPIGRFPFNIPIPDEEDRKVIHSYRANVK